MSNSYNEELSDMRTSVVAGAVGAGLLVAGCGMPGGGAESAPTRAEITAEGRVVDLARTAALGVLQVLGDEDGDLRNGAVAYDGNAIGNKAAVVGKDAKYPTADDRKVSEAFVKYDPIGNQLYGHALSYAPNSEDPTSYLGFSLKVNDSDPIDNIARPLTLTDFRDAVNRGKFQVDSLRAAAEVSDRDAAPAFNVSSVGSTLVVRIKENADDTNFQSDDPGVDIYSEYRPTFKDAVNRAGQIAGAAAVGLTTPYVNSSSRSTDGLSTKIDS